MIIKLNTSVTNRTVERGLWLNNFVEHTKVLNVYLIFKEFVDQGDKFETWLKIAWFTKGRQ